MPVVSGPEPPSGPAAGHSACVSLVMISGGDLVALGGWPGWSVGLAELLAPSGVEDGWVRAGEQVARCPHGSVFGAPAAEGPGPRPTRPNRAERRCTSAACSGGPSSPYGSLRRLAARLRLSELSARSRLGLVLSGALRGSLASIPGCRRRCVAGLSRLCRLAGPCSSPISDHSIGSMRPAEL